MWFISFLKGESIIHSFIQQIFTDGQQYYSLFSVFMYSHEKKDKIFDLR